MTPRPPELFESDSDYSDFDGFVFSDQIDEDGRRIVQRPHISVFDRNRETAIALSHTIRTGEVNEFKTIWNENRDILKINQPLLDGSNYTPLMLACQERQVDLVKYLLFDLNADPNANSNDMTALILTCAGTFNIYNDNDDIQEEEEANVRTICKWLIDRQAMVGKSNLRCETPLMYAASNGFVSVIKLLLEYNATLEAVNTDGKTALFYAVNDNRYEATKALIEAGALTTIEDKRLAEEKNYLNIVALFPPDPIIDCVPADFYLYQTYKDLIPTAFPEKKTPPYSPDIYTMLHGMRVQETEYKFYKSCIGLPEFLTINDERLREIGIEFPYQRKRILLGLLRFHEKAWSRKSLPIPKLNQANIQQYFEIFSNCLKQLIIIKSTLKFIEEHDIFTYNIDITTELYEQRQEIHNELTLLRKNALQLFQTMQKIENTLAVPPPLYICQNHIHELLKKNTFRQKLNQKLKLFGTIGFGIVAVALIKSRFY